MKSNVKLKYISTEEKNQHNELKNISFTIHAGESVAFFRSNQSDQSVYKLKNVIDRQLQPATGKVRVTELVNDLSDLNTLFRLNASGRKNIYLCCNAFGIDKLDVDVIEDDIIKFSGLENCIDDPMKNYSEEMRSQLAFAIGIFLKGKILIFDQTFCVENEEFLQKSASKLKEFLQRGGCLLLFTDSICMAKAFCNRGILIQDGRIGIDDIVDSTLEALQIMREDWK